jgi:hypothetical protein
LSVALVACVSVQRLAQLLSNPRELPNNLTSDIWFLWFNVHIGKPGSFTVNRWYAVYDYFGSFTFSGECGVVIYVHHEDLI